MNSVFTACNLLYHYQQGSEGTIIQREIHSLQVEGRDAIQIAINRKENHPRKGIGKNS